MGLYGFGLIGENNFIWFGLYIFGLFLFGCYFQKHAGLDGKSRPLSGSGTVTGIMQSCIRVTCVCVSE